MSRILGAQELERKRIARELHDETGQALTAILLGLRPFEDIDKSTADGLRQLVRDALASVRKLSIDLRPSALDDFGLVAALDRFTSDLRESSDLKVTLATHDLDTRLPEPVETAFYRVTQEAVANAIRHGDARSIQVELRHYTNTIRLTITDDGRGFDTEQIPADRVGLLGMRERITLVDGTLDLASQPGHGTTVTAEVPLATQ